jgi:hypothetical protein
MSRGLSFLKNEAYRDIFPNGEFGTDELFENIYPGYNGTIETYKYGKLSERIASEIKLSTGIFEDTKRNETLTSVWMSDVESIMTISEISISEKKKVTPARRRAILGVINGPYTTEKSKLGELINIRISGINVKFPGESSTKVRIPIVIPTHRSTRMDEVNIIKPNITAEDDLSQYDRSGETSEYISSIDRKKLKAVGGYDNNKLKEIASTLNIRTGNTKKDRVEAINTFLDRYQKREK